MLHQKRHLACGLMTVAFAIGYFSAEFLPTIATATSVGAAEAARIGSVFGATQMIGFIVLGWITDKARPLLPLKLAAWAFLLATLAGLFLHPHGFLLERALVGFGAGTIGSLFRTIGRLAPTKEQRAKYMATLSWTMTAGGSLGTILPIINRQSGVFIALVVLAVTLTLPTPKHDQEEKTPKRKLTRPIILLSLLSFFSAGAYAVFFLIVSKEIAPNLSVTPLAFWGQTSVLYFASAVTVWWLNRTHKTKVSDMHGLILSLMLSAFAYTLPVFGIIFTAQFLAITAGAFADSFWASLISRNSEPEHEGKIFGFALTIASAGRMFWPFMVSYLLN